MLNQGANVFAKNYLGWNMIHHASRRKNILILNYLLENYSSVIYNYTDDVSTEKGFFEIPDDGKCGHYILELMIIHARKTNDKKIALKL